ncbi:hypothetical protein DMW38_23880 [Vibrio parahaemolyticus]|nr:hypothetical protein [Vibrio parahaemolyticus]
MSELENEMYCEFGKAIAVCQTLEGNLKTLVSLVRALKGDRELSTYLLWQDTKLKVTTLGQLFKQLEHIVPEFQEVNLCDFEDAVKFRNILAHSYLTCNVDQCLDQEGLKKLIKQTRVYKSHISRVNKIVSEYIERILLSGGVDKDKQLEIATECWGEDKAKNIINAA